ncbi:unnamed protein product [Allacma fusca]|uniref:Protein kinase domain-containing protein n=1 Tax=Allacma fusca TaxID=39272 RepID=A0A8J2LU66_9HEXA|nr:unnamed protein product [Allacma fusca]
MVTFSHGLKLDKRKLVKPCFGIFLPGSVKNTTIANGFLAVASMIIFGAGIIEYLNRENFYNQDPLQQILRPLFWIAYYSYWGAEIYLSLVLYSASKRLNFGECKRWIYIQSFGLVVFLTLYSFHCFWLANFNIILRVLLGILSVYKVYNIWVVYCFMLWVREKHPAMRNIIMQLTDADLEEFENGSSSQTREGSGPAQNPYDRSFEINKECLTDRSTWTFLSQTEFSSVYQAVYNEPGSTPIPVAVKTIRSELSYFKTQLCEFKIRTELGRHQNIVGLIGANTGNIRNRELELIVEYCPYGNLESFLQNKKMLGLFINQLDSFGRFCGTSKPEVPASKTVDVSLPIIRSVETIKTSDLVRWALHIARGMAYLNEVKVIHGDLAIRNVLLTSDLTAKINDFGLSKQCYSYRGYVRCKEKRIPWRSMAPECFSGKINFSFESDVWAYGVTLWEMFSVGDIPYSYLDTPDERFVYSLKNGKNPGCPAFAPPEIYQIMQSCWNLEPKQRCSFADIVRKLEAFSKTFSDENSNQRRSLDQIALNMTPGSNQSGVVPTHLPAILRSNPYIDHNNVGAVV